MREAFPLNERDIFVIASSQKPFTPADIEVLRELHLDLQLLDETESVLSLFSVRDSVVEDGYAAPLVPDELPEGEAFKALMARVHAFAAGKLISANPMARDSGLVRHFRRRSAAPTSPPASTPSPAPRSRCWAKPVLATSSSASP